MLHRSSWPGLLKQRKKLEDLLEDLELDLLENLELDFARLRGLHPYTTSKSQRSRAGDKRGNDLILLC